MRPIVEDERFGRWQVTAVPAIEQRDQAEGIEFELHQAKRILAVDRTEYGQQQLVVAKRIDLPNIGVTHVGKDRHAAISQVELTQVATRSKIEVAPVLARLIGLAA